MKICNESGHIKQTLHTTSLSFWAENRFGSVRPSVRRELWYGQLLLQFKWESSNMLVYYNMKLGISLLCLLYICISLYNVQLVFVMNIHKILLDVKKQKTNQTKNVCRHSIINWKSSSYVIFWRFHPTILD